MNQTGIPSQWISLSMSCHNESVYQKQVLIHYEQTIDTSFFGTEMVKKKALDHQRLNVQIFAGGWETDRQSERNRQT